MARRIIKCVLSGGAKGGKTSAVHFLETHMRENGYVVMTVPNALSMLYSSGVVEPSPHSSKEALVAFTTALLKLQINLEDTFCCLSKVEAPILGGPEADILVLLDCAALDIKGRVTLESWEAALQALGTTEELIMGRYDVVFHLESAPKEDSQSQPGRTGDARTDCGTEDPGLDNIIMQCWRAHPHHYTVFNKPESPTFQQKMADLLVTFQSYIDATKQVPCDRS